MTCTNQIKIQPVILCGGSGTRLWPLSRSGFPKQFLCLSGNESLFQQAALRLASIGHDGVQLADPFIVSSEEHRFLVSEQLREVGIPTGTALLEPVGRNTAPALTLAALAATQGGQDPVLVVTPADQTIANNLAFIAAIKKSIEVASDGTIMILGVKPTQPEIGFGYIKTEQSFISGAEEIHNVLRFVEKPNLVDAQAYLDEGNYYWNAGIFVLKASVWLKSLKQFRPDIFENTLAAWNKKIQDGTFVRPGKTEFAAIPAESIDYAVIERCPGQMRVAMASLEAGWSDLGSWDAVWNVLPRDANGNAQVGDVLIKDSRNTLVHATNRLVTLVGVQDLVVVETSDAVLVANKACSQDVKLIVSQLQNNKREELALHRKVHRPWGWYDCIDQGGHFKVKRIQVKPGASLSLQKHNHRAEHWIVVKGTAEITNGDKVLLLTENQSTYIPLGEVHRLANPGNIPLEIIEVQSGSYLGEDDIIRLEDYYGRASL